MRNTSSQSNLPDYPSRVTIRLGPLEAEALNRVARELWKRQGGGKPLNIEPCLQQVLKCALVQHRALLPGLHEALVLERGAAVGVGAYWATKIHESLSDYYRKEEPCR